MCATPLRYHAVTLGCKVNQYETEYLCQGLELLGYCRLQPGEQADLCVVNTCTVTAEADHKSRKAIRQLARRFPRARLIVMGCYTARAAEELAALPGVAEVVTDKQQLPQLLMRLGLSDPPSGIGRFGQRHRAYVKVQDGCNLPCSYCIIPKVRPALVSRRVDEVLAEISRLVSNGYREVVLTGVHLGLYGADLGGGDGCTAQQPATHTPARSTARANLTGLVRRIVALPGQFRVRLSTLEASELSDELLSIIGDNPQRICQHLHLSMQSGSDAVLRRMRRPWPAAHFLERCLHVRDRLPMAALTADVIVGFPGETEEDFAATCAAVEQIGFAKLHVFRFSPRPGTAAADLPDRVPHAVKQRRAEQLETIGQRLRRQYFHSLLGQPLEVLVEQSASAAEVAGQQTCAGKTCWLNSDSPVPHAHSTNPVRQAALHTIGRAAPTPAVANVLSAQCLLLGTASQYVPVQFWGCPSLVGKLVVARVCTIENDRVSAEILD